MSENGNQRLKRWKAAMTTLGPELDELIEDFFQYVWFKQVKVMKSNTGWLWREYKVWCESQDLRLGWISCRKRSLRHLVVHNGAWGKRALACWNKFPSDAGVTHSIHTQKDLVRLSELEAMPWCIVCRSILLQFVYCVRSGKDSRHIMRRRLGARMVFDRLVWKEKYYEDDIGNSGGVADAAGLQPVPEQVGGSNSDSDLRRNSETQNPVGSGHEKIGAVGTNSDTTAD